MLRADSGFWLSHPEQNEPTSQPARDVPLESSQPLKVSSGGGCGTAVAGLFINPAHAPHEQNPLCQAGEGRYVCRPKNQI